MAEEKREMSPALKGHFEVVGVLPGEFNIFGKTYDLRTMDLKTAEDLHKRGCRYLKKVSGGAQSGSGNPGDKK